MDAEPVLEAARHEGVTVFRDQENRLVARKAITPGQGDRLRREVAVLQLLEGLAVVAPIERGDDGSRGEIDLAYVGPRTLANCDELQPIELLAVLAAVARTLEAAHQRGVSHGRLDAEHVLLDEDAMPILTGWSQAGLRDDARTRINHLMVPPTKQLDAGDPPLEGPNHPDQDHHGHGPPFDPAADIAALGELAARSAQANPLAGGRVRTQLAAVAAASRHPDPARRPALSELARVLELTRATSKGPSVALRQGRHRAGRVAALAHSHRGRLLAAAATAGTAAAFTIILFGHSASTHPVALDAYQMAAAATVDVSAAPVVNPDPTPHNFGPVDAVLAAPSTIPGTPSPTTSAVNTSACPTGAAHIAREGLPTRCADGAELTGEQLQIGLTRYSLGVVGDEAGLVDPHCAGQLAPVLWERSSGRVYVFDRWATIDQPVPGRVVGVVPGSSGLADRFAQQCGAIRIAMADGTITELEARVTG